MAEEDRRSFECSCGCTQGEAKRQKEDRKERRLNVKRTIALLGKVQVSRCAEGERLYQNWSAALETHSQNIIYAAMEAYFCHKNGILDCDWKLIEPGCRECKFVEKDDRRINLLKLEKATQELMQAGRLSDDPRVINKLLEFEKDDQVEMARVLAASQASPWTALEAIACYQEYLNGEKFSSEKFPVKGR